MTLISEEIRPGWAVTPYDWQITSTYCEVFKEAPQGLTIQQQLSAIFDMFAEYRTEFGQLSEVRCETCHNFFDEFGDCLYCEDEEIAK